MAGVLLFYDSMRSAANLIILLVLGLGLACPVEASFRRSAEWGESRILRLDQGEVEQYTSNGNLHFPSFSPTAVEIALQDSDHRISPIFHVPKRLRPIVEFWFRIYTSYSSQQIVLFDSNHPEVVYEVLDFRTLAQVARGPMHFALSSRKILDDTVERYRKAFGALERNPRPKHPTREQRRILEAIAKGRHTHRFAAWAKGFKTQTGQRDAIVKGLPLADAHFERMETLFTLSGLPWELTRLSLLESSFNFEAQSHAGALGVWQFIPETGRAYLLMDKKSGIDERLSPFKSTVAAARLLRFNYRYLGHWTLATLAYNRGARGLPRLKRQSELELERLPRVLGLLESCELSGARLGWASRNYYAEFLAILHAEAYRNFFYGAAPARSQDVERPVMFTRVNEFLRTRKTPNALQFAKDHGISIGEFRRLNPDVQDLKKPLPRGFLVAVPAPKDDLRLLLGKEGQRLRADQARRRRRTAAVQ